MLAQDSKHENTINNLLSELPGLLKTDGAGAKSRIKDALKLSQQNSNYKYGQLAYWMGESLLNHAQYDSAGLFYQSALPFLEKENDEPILGRAYIGAGYILNFQTRYNDALAFDLKAEKIFRKNGDRKMLARSLKRIGDDILYQDEKRGVEAMPYYEESIAISREEKDTINIIRGLNAATTIYTSEKNFQKIDEAMTQAIALAEKIKCVRCMAISYSQWGISEHKRGNYEEAIRKYKLEFEMNKKMGADYDQFFVYQNIAEAYYGLKKYEATLTYSDSSLRIAETDVAWNHYHDVYEVKYKAYKAMNNAPKALAAYEKQMQFKDSIFSEEKERAMEDMKAAYNLERKERQIEDLEKENLISELEATTARQWQYGLIIFLVLLAIVIAVLYNRYQLKQKTTKILSEKNLELNKLNSFKDRMFAVISHDLRNPVSAFSTLMESLHQNVQHATQEELKEFMQSTLQSARDLQSLLNNLLEWALVQIGRLPYQPQALKLTEVINESNRHVELMADQKKIKITDETNGEIVFADKAMLTIVVRNLLSNAIKFSPENSQITINAKQTENTVQVAIRDNGIGMKPEDVSKLFKQEENTQSIGSSAEKGAGIGLLLCKDLMDKNNGKISAESVQGKETVFYLELPKP
jgi:signal transduction histidine kinase